MMSDNEVETIRTILKAYMEPIVFDEDRLSELKEYSMKLQEGKIDGVTFRRKLLNDLMSMMNNLLDNVMFYFKDLKLQQQLSTPNENESEQVAELQRMIAEREELLELSGKRLESLIQSFMEG